MPIRVTCTQCGKTLRAPDRLAGRQARCAACGTLVAVPTQPPPTQPAPPSQQYKTCPYCAEAILATAIKCRYCGEFFGGPAAGAMGPPHGHSLGSFPTGVLILLHFLTVGLFSMIWLNLMHGHMPKIRPNDPSAGAAIGFMFIPFFNIYWMFFTYHRLCVRINEQCAWAGLRGDVPTGLAIATCIVLLIPCASVVGAFILFPIFAGMVQSKVNELVRAAERP